jgi:hypothetical protein
MGEYVRLDGHLYKLGTCESLYYVRYADLAGWIAAGRVARAEGNDEPRAYLAGAYRFRFPFPDEDGPEDARLAAYGQDYQRGVTVPAPAGLLAGLDHMPVRVWLKHGLRYVGGVSVALPCPMTPEFDQVTHGPVADDPAVTIFQQRPIDGRLWVVVGCPWCGALVRLEEAEAARLADRLPADHAEFGRRIRAGYAGGEG